MDLRGYLDVAKRWWWTLAAATWVAGVAAFVIASQFPSVYESQERLLVGPINGDYNTLHASGSLVQTYAQLVISDPLLAGTIAELKLNITSHDLAKEVDASGSDTTRIITISANWSDPQTAAAIATSLVKGLTTLSTQGLSRPEGQLTVVEPAVPAPNPSGPQITLIVLFAAAAGLSGALLIVLLAEHLSDTVKGTYELQHLEGAPLLATVTRVRYTPTPIAPLVVEALPALRTSEQYRLLATKVRAHERTQSRLMVLGAELNDGSVEVAANLAAVLSRRGRSVRLIEADEVGEELSRLFDLAEHDGIDAIIAGERVERVEVHRPPNLLIIPHGRGRRVMEPDSVEAVLAAAEAGGHLVIVHASPLHISNTALLWTQACQATLLVANRGSTRRAHLDYAVETVQQTKTELIGTVLLEPPGGLPWRHETPQHTTEVTPRPPALTARRDDRSDAAPPDVR